MRISDLEFRRVLFRSSDDLSLYLSAAKGTKSGGINAGVSVLATPANPNILPEWATYKPEKAWSYEAGLKFNLLDRRLTGSIAAYYVDWTNQQVSNTRTEESREGKGGFRTCRTRWSAEH